MLSCRLLEVEDNPEAVVKTLLKEFIPLMDRFWDARGRAYYSSEHWHIQAVPFTQALMNGSMALILASDGAEPAGFLLGVHLQPMLLPDPAFEVEALYGTTAEAELGLLDYLKQAARFFKERFIVLPDYAEAIAPGKFAELGSRTARKCHR